MLVGEPVNTRFRAGEIVQILADVVGACASLQSDLAGEAFAIGRLRPIEQQQAGAGPRERPALRPAKRPERSGQQYCPAGKRGRHSRSCTSSTDVSPTGLSNTISPRAIATIRSQEWKTWGM